MKIILIVIAIIVLIVIKSRNNSKKFSIEVEEGLSLHGGLPDRINEYVENFKGSEEELLSKKDISYELLRFLPFIKIEIKKHYERQTLEDNVYQVVIFKARQSNDIKEYKVDSCLKYDYFDILESIWNEDSMLYKLTVTEEYKEIEVRSFKRCYNLLKKREEK